jgi:hypothetical protein
LPPCTELRYATSCSDSALRRRRTGRSGAHLCSGVVSGRAKNGRRRPSRRGGHRCSRGGGRAWLGSCLATRRDGRGGEEKGGSGGGRSRSSARPTQRGEPPPGGRTGTRYQLNNAEHRCPALHGQLCSFGLVDQWRPGLISLRCTVFPFYFDDCHLLRRSSVVRACRS